MAGDNEEASTQRLQSSFGTSSSSLLKQHQQQQQQNPFSMNQLEIPQPNMSQSRGLVRPVPTNFAVENGCRRVGIPPSHPQTPPISPYSQIPVNRPANQHTGFHNFSTINPGPSHSRSLSQPLFFANDSLPPLSPSPYRELHSNSISEQVSADVSMEDMDGSSNSLLMSAPFTRGGNSLRIGEGLPPRKAHRRSNSDIPFGFMSSVQPSPPLIPLRSPGALDRSMLVKRESSWDNNGEGTGERKQPEGEVVDDLFSAYMNLENIEAFNSSNTDEKPGEDLDSRASGTKTNGCDSSDNEATSSVNESGSSSQRAGVSERREGVKRCAAEDITPTTRHYRSISMDSFMGKINFGDESPKMPPSPGTLSSQQLSPTDSLDANSNAFSLEFGNGEFTGAELKKIMANEKLTEIAMSDPKRAKRILANRQSAARSKERKMRYIAELEHKVQTLQTEATTLSAQLTLLQRDSTGLTNQNNELKFRLQAMEQQAHLRDALNEALTAEVQRLKVATTELSGGDTSRFQQLSISPHTFQLRHHQATQITIRQLHQQQLSQQSNDDTSPNNESSE